MNLTRQLFLSTALLAAIAQPAVAVQMSNSTMATTAIAKPTGSVIERGGIVTSFDPVKKIVVVDNVLFTLSAGPVKIHQRGASNDKSFILKPGMQIRFDTSKENFAVQDRVLEIWVTKLDEKPPTKPGAKLPTK